MSANLARAAQQTSPTKVENDRDIVLNIFCSS